MTLRRRGGSRPRLSSRATLGHLDVGLKWIHIGLKTKRTTYRPKPASLSKHRMLPQRNLAAQASRTRPTLANTKPRIARTLRSFQLPIFASQGTKGKGTSRRSISSSVSSPEPYCQPSPRRRHTWPGLRGRWSTHFHCVKRQPPVADELRTPMRGT
jgi:hypothetical protein